MLASVPVNLRDEKASLFLFLHPPPRARASIHSHTHPTGSRTWIFSVTFRSFWQ